MNFDFFLASDMLGRVFWGCAIGGTLFFLLRVIMMVVGGDLDDAGDGGDVGDMGDADGFSDVSDVAFTMFSINSITAFVMMFGWAGLTTHVQYEVSSLRAVFIALMVGILAMLITAYLFQIAMKLVSRGAQFTIESVVGMNVKVYQQIPAHGLGKIHVSIPGGMTREVGAISEDKVLIESFKLATVVRVVDQNTVSVKEV